MALNVVITATAQEDLVDIWSWIAEESPASADRVLDRMQEVSHKLAELPKKGDPAMSYSQACARSS